MPRFSLGDVGGARWPLSHRWTDTGPILLDAAHDNRNHGRVVSVSVLSLLSACVRLCQLREVVDKSPKVYTQLAREGVVVDSRQ